MRDVALYSRPRQTWKLLKQLCGTMSSGQASASAFWALSERQLTLRQSHLSCTPAFTASCDESWCIGFPTH